MFSKEICENQLKSLFKCLMPCTLAEIINDLRALKPGGRMEKLAYQRLTTIVGVTEAERLLGEPLNYLEEERQRYVKTPDSRRKIA